MEINEKYLITTDAWFFAPDGEQYRAVWGTVKGIYLTEDVLGIKTNEKSTNWYVLIGNTVLAGCQIHYAIKTNKCNFLPVNREFKHEDILVVKRENKTRIFNADGEG